MKGEGTPHAERPAKVCRLATLRHTWSNNRYLNAKISTGAKGKKVSHDPEEGVRVSAPAATLFGLSALLLSISMVNPQNHI